MWDKYDQIALRFSLFLDKIKFAFQRLFYGYADIDLWGLDYCFARYILPRLKAFKKRDRMGYPGNLVVNGETSEKEDKKNIKQWEEILDKMIFSMECIADDYDSWEDEIYGDYFERAYPKGFNIENRKPLSKELEEEHKIIMKKLEEVNDKIDEGLMLFGKYFRSLWD